MRSSGSRLAFLTVLTLSASAVAQPAAPAEPTAPAAPVQPVPPAPPVVPAPAAAPAAAAAPHGIPPLQNAAVVRQGVARLERAGHRIGLGAVLRADGRILTALSALGHGNFVQARFADDSVLPLKVVATDRAWDLALLAPEGGHWTQGLRPSTLDAPEAGGSLYRFRARGSRLEEGSIGVTVQKAALGRDGALLGDVLALSPRSDDDELGSPLFDARGDVAAIVVQACAPNDAQSCQLIGYGAPVSALKQFLKRAPRREPLPAAYIGLRGIAATEGAVAGVRVIAVDAGSPAERAGLHAEGLARGSGEATGGDLIVAVEDAPVTTPDELREAINRFALAVPSGAAVAQKSGGDAAGDAAARLLVFGSGKFREVRLSVRAPRPLPAPSPAPQPASSAAVSATTANAAGTSPPAEAAAPAQPAPAPAPVAPGSTPPAP